MVTRTKVVTWVAMVLIAAIVITLMYVVDLQARREHRETVRDNRIPHTIVIPGGRR